MAKRRKSRSRNNPQRDAEPTKASAGRKRAALQADTLEPQILLSATWVDAETGDAQDAATETDVNEAITNVDFSGRAVAENSPAGAVVGVATATDPDAGEHFTYELADDAGGRFAIDPNSGLITVAEGADLNFESADRHILTIKVADSAGHERSENFEIRVADVNEAITRVEFTANAVRENAPAGTVVGQALAIDPDVGEKVRYELSDDAGGRFRIDPNWTAPS